MQEMLPGFFGYFFMNHFLPYLQITITTPEQQEAYQNILDFWDNVKIRIPLFMRLGSYLMYRLPKPDVKQAAAQMEEQLRLYTSPSEEEYRKLRDKTRQNVKMKNSLFYKYHPVFISQRHFMKRLQDCGYNDIFIPNMIDPITAKIRTWSVMEGQLFLLKENTKLTLVIAQKDIQMATSARKRIISNLKQLRTEFGESFYWGLGCIVDSPKSLSKSLLAAEEMQEYCAFSLSQIDGSPSDSLLCASAPARIKEAENLLLIVEEETEVQSILRQVQEDIQLQNNSANIMKAQTIDFAYQLRIQFELSYEDISAVFLDWDSKIMSPLLSAPNLDCMFDILQEFVSCLREYSAVNKDRYKQGHISRIKQYILDN